MTHTTGLAVFLICGVAAVAYAAYQLLFSGQTLEQAQHTYNNSTTETAYVYPETSSNINTTNRRRKRRNSREYCSICLSGLGGAVKTLPCNHTFHFNCIKTWVERENSCPNCRARIV